MSQARVDSITALESLRAALIVFLTKSKQSLDHAIDETARTGQWLRQDRLPYWKTQVKRREQKLQQAEQELMTARFSQFIDRPEAQQLAVRRARAAHAEAVEKLVVIQRWIRDFDQRATLPVRRLESLRDYVTLHLPKASAELHQAITALEAYTEREVPAAGPPPA